MTEKQVSMEALAPKIKEIVDAGGFVKIRAQGQSMLPALVEGKSIITLGKAETLETGDIVLFRNQKNKYILHRIIQIAEIKSDNGERRVVIRTKGDNNEDADKSVTSDMVIAKVMKVELDQSYKIDPNRSLYITARNGYRTMKKALKKILVIALAVGLIISLPAASFAYSRQQLNTADALYQEGLFKGMGTTYALDKGLTRTEGLVLLVRLLGKEAEALACKYPDPFVDIKGWEDRYLAWAYHNGITNGVTATTFCGLKPMTNKELTVMFLRALGYTEKDGDYGWWDVIEKDFYKKLTGGTSSISELTRGEAVIIMWTALETCPKGSNTKLTDKLQAEGLFTEEQREAALRVFAEGISAGDETGEAANYIPPEEQPQQGGAAGGGGGAPAGGGGAPAGGGGNNNQGGGNNTNTQGGNTEGGNSNPPEEKSYTVTYSDPSKANSDSSSTVKASSVTLTNASFSRSGYTLAGWALNSTSTKADYKVGDSVPLSGTGLTFYAIWEPVKITYSITVIDPSGANGEHSFTTQNDTTSINDLGFYRSGYKLLGWSVTSGGSVKYNLGQTINLKTTAKDAKLTLYAVWEKLPDTGGNGLPAIDL